MRDTRKALEQFKPVRAKRVRAQKYQRTAERAMRASAKAEKEAAKAAARSAVSRPQSEPAPVKQQQSTAAELLAAAKAKKQAAKAMLTRTVGNPEANHPVLTRHGRTILAASLILAFASVAGVIGFSKRNVDLREPEPQATAAVAGAVGTAPAQTAAQSETAIPAGAFFTETTTTAVKHTQTIAVNNNIIPKTEQNPQSETAPAVPHSDIPVTPLQNPVIHEHEGYGYQQDYEESAPEQIQTEATRGNAALQIPVGTQAPAGTSAQVTVPTFSVTAAPSTAAVPQTTPAPTTAPTTSASTTTTTTTTTPAPTTTTTTTTTEAPRANILVDSVSVSNWSDFNGKSQQYISIELYNDSKVTFDGTQVLSVRCDTDSKISFVSCTSGNVTKQPTATGSTITVTFSGELKARSYTTVILRVISGESFRRAYIV